MATLNIRNLDDALKANLRVRAALHGQSMEEEARSILRHALATPTPQGVLGQHLAQRFKNVSAELEIPPRSTPRALPSLDTPA